jgi:CRISPR-associated protein Csx14
MNRREPSISVNVDVTNPGQFFACCGLLELADRLWPGAEGWFEGITFCLAGDFAGSSADQMLATLLHCPEFLPEVTKKSSLGGSTLKLLPFTLTFPSSVLRIDWWRDETRPPGKGSAETCARGEFKTWAGNQSPQQIIYDQLLPAMRRIVESSTPNWFSVRVPLSGRFGFDHTAAVEAIDAGWSPDKLELPVATSPAVELLAMIGLQRFRPATCKSRFQFAYSTWRDPATALIAALKASCALSDTLAQRFTFGIGTRGDYRFFGAATPAENIR